ncbi:hypothetical protein [Metabacillus niabensis]
MIIFNLYMLLDTSLIRKWCIFYGFLFIDALIIDLSLAETFAYLVKFG